MECWKVLRRNNLSPPKQLDFQMLSVQNPKQSYTRAVARFFLTGAGGGGEEGEGQEPISREFRRQEPCSGVRHTVSHPISRP